MCRRRHYKSWGCSGRSLVPSRLLRGPSQVQGQGLETSMVVVREVRSVRCSSRGKKGQALRRPSGGRSWGMRASDTRTHRSRSTPTAPRTQLQQAHARVDKYKTFRSTTIPAQNTSN